MDIDIRGLDDVLKNLATLNIDAAVEDRALNKAGKITQEAVKNEAPVGKSSGGVKLKNNIRLRRPKDGEVIIHTGRAYHAHILEFGRSAGSTNGKGGVRRSWGAMAPNPFFSRAFEQSKESAKQAMIDEIQKGLRL